MVYAMSEGPRPRHLVRRCLVHLRGLPHGVRFDSPLLVSLLLPCLLPACLLSSLLFGPVAAEEAAEWKGERVLKDGVVHVMNPAEPMEPPLVFELRELWRLESEAEDGEVVFGAIERARRDEEGSLYLLDSSLHTGHVISADGTYLRSISREGEGPGELRSPMDLHLLSDGRVAIVDGYPPRVVLMSRSGAFEGEWKPELHQASWAVLYRAYEVPHGYVLSLETGKRKTDLTVNSMFLGIFGSDGDLVAKPLERIQERRRGQTLVHDEEKSETFFCLDVASDGSIYVSPHYSEYSIHVFHPDGSLRMVIEREFEPLPRSPEQLTDMRAYWAHVYQKRSHVEIRMQEHERRIEELHVHEDGSIWVETSRGWYDSPEDVAVVLDVFDSEGRFVRQVVYRKEIDSWNDSIFFFSDRLLIGTGAAESSRGASSISTSDDRGDDDEAIPTLIYCEMVPGE